VDSPLKNSSEEEKTKETFSEKGGANSRKGVKRALIARTKRGKVGKEIATLALCSGRNLHSEQKKKMRAEKSKFL